EFPVDIRRIGFTNEIFALSRQDSALARNNSPQLLCRIFFSAITDTIICIEEIKEIINQDFERTVHYIYGGCRNTTTTGISNAQSQIAVALIPNPVTNVAYLQLQHDVTPEIVEIMDMTGRVTQVSLITKGH
ncbi:MAG TPA: hypothetical protein PKD91_07975, partial [Bacteroidia bacterium]|nr:hypothetical protein [Bacteroidia bacterium]